MACRSKRAVHDECFQLTCTPLIHNCHSHMGLSLLDWKRIRYTSDNLDLGSNECIGDIMNTPGKPKENAVNKATLLRLAHAPSHRRSSRSPAMHSNHKPQLTYKRSFLGAPCFKIQPTYVHTFLRKLAVKFGPCPVSVLVAGPRGHFLRPGHVVLRSR